MLTLAGYVISEVIHNGARTAVYRATRTQDGQSVILKLPQAELPAPEENARLQREYEILMGFDIASIVKAHTLELHNNRQVLVLEDAGGISLKQSIPSGGMELALFLEIAIQVTSALEVVHQKKILHRDIKPRNILIHCLTRAVKLIDFSISSYLSCDFSYSSLATPMEGTLPYIAPEQTGRTHRRVDHRSDLYSLGATFYELLTGVLPFPVTDPLDLIHCHILKQPLSPLVHRPSLPPVVSQLVMKLLEKNAEDRYQSSSGLRMDLEHCQQQLLQTGTIVAFPLGQHDQSGYLLIPQQLYGREREQELLSKTLKRMVGEGHSLPPRKEFLLIKGPAGIGKSALAQDLQQSIWKQQGYFISGKCDVRQEKIPCQPVIQALRDLARQLGAESVEQLGIWKQRLSQFQGPALFSLLELLPELEMIVPTPSLLPDPDPLQAQPSPIHLFQTLIQVFAQPEHPLVLFLDNLQWADPATLTLIQVLLTHPRSQALLILGAYRDDGMGLDHPLQQTIAQLQSQEAIIQQIELTPLTLDAATHLIRDALGHAPTVAPLANLLWEKTGGNPLILTQGLKALYQDDLVSFDFPSQQWVWNLKAIAQVDLSHVIPALMRKLPRPTQTLLKLAACLGNRFKLETLAEISNQTLSTTASDLWIALQAGVLLPLFPPCPLSPNLGEDTAVAASYDYQLQYCFAHDWMQEAAYAFSPDGQDEWIKDRSLELSYSFQPQS